MGEDTSTAPTLVSSPSPGAEAPSGDSPSSSEDLRSRFDVVDELGRGGMGLVVSARDRQLGRTVALKVLHPGLANEETVVRRFLLEAQVGAQLEHPNIVPVYGMETDDGAPAFSMRLLEGETLKEYLEESKANVTAGKASVAHTLDERLERFLKVCDAISYAHSEGVVHRDLKPANVILGEHHEVYLVDWGVAKVLGGEEVPSGRPSFEALPNAVSGGAQSQPGVSVSVAGATQHGELVGTPTYMPPEQATGELERHGPASDQFALGMLLQQVVSLELPRRGDLMTQVFAATRGDREPFTSNGEGGPAPRALRAIVARATEHDPEDRYESVNDLADDVRRFVRDEEVGVAPDPWSRRLWRRLSRRPGTVLAVFMGVVLLALVGAVASLGRALVLQQRAAEEAARLSAVTSAVVVRSEAIDWSFGRARALVEGLAVAVEQLHAYAPAEPGPLRYGASGRLVGHAAPPLSGLHRVDRYGEMEVTFDMGLYLYPPTVSHEDVERTIRVMGSLNETFRDVMLRSRDDEAATLARAEQRALLDEGRTPIHVTYVGFENGLLLNFPGYEPFPDDYDPRRRPWYREAMGAHGVHFGRPYPDASGSAILVPCNRAMRDPDGELLGVAGADMALDDLARLMRFDDLAGWRRSSLVNERGEQILDTEQEGLRLGVGLHGDEALEATPVEPEVLAVIESEQTGFVQLGRELVVFDRLEELGWTLVVRLDAAP